MGIRLKGQTSGYVEIKAPATAADNTLTLPNGNGSSNQVLTTDGSGGLTFAAPQLSTDTTPQLGGDLDVNGNDIVTTSNGDIDLDPNGSGQVVFKGNATRGSGAVKLNCENNSHGILVKGPPHSAGANYTLTLPNDTGTSGQLLSTNGSGVTSWTTVNAAPAFTATASGAIADGDPCVIKTDGTVAKVAISNTAKNPVTSSNSNWNDISSVQSNYTSAVYMPDNGAQIAVFWQDASNNDRARVKMINALSDGSIAEGTEYEVTGNTTFFNKVVYDTNVDKFLFVYKDGSNSGKTYCKVGTFANNAWTFGGHVAISPYSSAFCDAVYDPDSQKIVVIYEDQGSSGSDSQGKAVVGTISGTSISFGTAVSFGSTNTSRYDITYDTTANKVIIAYTDGADSEKGKAVVGTVSGTSISFGSASTFESGTTDQSQIVYASGSDRLFVVYQDEGNSNALTGCVGSVSGTSITWGTPAQIGITTVHDDVPHSVAYDSDADNVLITYSDLFSNGGTLFVRPAVIGTNSFTLNNEVIVNNNQGFRYLQTVHDPSQSKMVIGGSYYGSQYLSFNTVDTVTSSSNLTVDNFVGISNGAYGDGTTATIQTFGAVDDAQSGLTTAQKYYVQGDGTLGTSQTEGTGTLAGIALSATKLLISGN